MNRNQLMIAKIKNRLAKIARTAHQLTESLSKAEWLPPTQEMRLAHYRAVMHAARRQTGSKEFRTSVDEKKVEIGVRFLW